MGKTLFKLFKLLIYTSVGVAIGLSVAFLDLSIFELSVCFLVQLAVFVLIHEFAHGKVAEMNGLRFTKLYAGPIIVIRKDKRFVRIKKNKLQGTYLGRANIENGEIRSDLEFDRHVIAWKRAISAGPKSDIVLSILCLAAGIYFKYPIIIVSTIVLDLAMCIPSYFYGDGTHYKSMERDDIFTVSVMYSNSIIGEDGISPDTEKYLVSRLENELEKTEINDDTIVSLSIAARTLLFQKILDGKYSGYRIEEIIWDVRDGNPARFKKMTDRMYFRNLINTAVLYYTCIENDFWDVRDGNPARFKKMTDRMYFRNLINTAVLYYTCIENDLKKAQILFRSIKNTKHVNYVEKNDFIRSRYVLGMQNNKEELVSHKYRNPIFKGCKSLEESEDKMDEIVIEYVDKMGFY